MRLLLHRFPAAGGLLLFTLLCAAALAAPKYFRGNAATLIVTNTNDSGPGSLRQALAGVQNGDTIQFDPALNGQAITLTTAELIIASNVTIEGPGPSLLTIRRDQQAPDFRIFHIMPGHTVEINGLTVTAGHLASDGGGIFNDNATLTISNCTISGNSIMTTVGSPALRGGGIYNTGTLTLVNSATRLNQAVWLGGFETYGGGIFNAGTMTISQDIIELNTTDWHGGGILNDGLMTIVDSTISGNRSGFSGSHFTGQGGGIYNRSGSLTIQNSTVSGNTAGGDPQSGFGGGIFNTAALTITHSTISGNQANRFGGGIDGSADITDSIISNNRTLMQDGGGIAAGGGTITNSTISGNVASGRGGGISGSPTIINSTISGNAANQGGGALFGGGAITNSTISGNTANQGGGIYATVALEIGNTLMKAGASGANIFNNGGTVTSHGYNVSSDNGGGFLTGPGDQINTDPLLGPLQDNGGPTFTHNLLTGSPAIDTGDPNFIPPPSTDQRGYARVFNGRIDIGSLEVQPTPTPTATGTPTPTATATATPTSTATPCTLVSSWTSQSPYPIAVSGSAVASQGGNVYSFGGISNNVAIANAYKYTPATNTWTPIAFLPAPRGWFSAASDGTYIYLLGGVDENFTTTATLWRYDPASDTYNTSLPPYTIPTYFHATVYLNGKIYRIAGRATGTDFHVEVYDIATNSWSLAANYPFANHSLMAAALGGYVYGAGGNASPAKTYRYDPGANTWDDVAIADLPAGRSAAASCVYNGMWVLAGGDVNFAVSTSVIAWSPASNTWSNLPNMVQARDYLGGATAGQSIYAVAGNSGPGTPTNDNQQYTETSCTTPTPTPTPSTTPIFVISGTVSYCSNPGNPPVPGVTMSLTGPTPAPESTLTNGNGDYVLTGLFNGVGPYTVTPTKAALLPGANGIDTADVIALVKHFLNIGPPLSGCRLTAADVNGDTSINTVDVIAIQRFYIALPTGIANTGKYQFTPASRTYSGINSNQTGQNYDTLVFGDVAAPFVE